MNGNSYKKVLNERGISVSFVARKIGTNRSQLSRFINNSDEGSYITKKQLNELDVFIKNYLGIEMDSK